MTTALNALVALPLGSLEEYERGVNLVPMLGAEEERRLARQFRDHHDLDAARQLVLSHLRFVVRVARGYQGYGLAQADLIQEGNIGLMKAVKRFDPEMGVRLVSFAVHWIRAEIHEFILRNWRIVKVATTKAQRKLFFNLRGAKKRLGWMTRDEVDAVAEDLGVPAKAVLEMEQRLNAHDAPYDGYGSGDDEERPAPAGYLPDQRFDPALEAEADDWSNHAHDRLFRAMETLDDRSRRILERRWLGDDKSTLQELADEYQVSAERIRQLEKNALKKLKTTMAA